MIRADETALICDLAETYGILDWRALPLKTAAALSAGLKGDSRIRMKISGQRIDSTTALLAAAVDRLGMIAWLQTKDGAEGTNRPASILRTLLDESDNTERDFNVYNTPEEFEEARRKALSGEE